MPPTHKQQRGLCFAYSGMQLLHHHLCKTWKKCNFGDATTRGPDDYALRDALDAYYANERNGRFREGGHTFNFLDSIIKKGRLTPDSCAPAGPMEAAFSLYRGENIFDELEKFHAVYWARKSSTCMMPPPHTVGQVQGMNRFFAEVRAAREQYSQREFMRDVLVTPNCLREGRPFPPFSSTSFDSVDSGELLSKIDSVLESGRPLSFEHNYFRRQSPGLEPDKFGAHAANIAGKRVRCCNDGACRLEYFIMDSAGNDPTDRWENAYDVVNSIKDMSGIYVYLNAFAENPNTTLPMPLLLKLRVEEMRKKTGREVSKDEMREMFGRFKGYGRALTWIEPP